MIGGKLKMTTFAKYMFGVVAALFLVALFHADSAFAEGASQAATAQSAQMT